MIMLNKSKNDMRLNQERIMTCDAKYIDKNGPNIVA